MIHVQWPSCSLRHSVIIVSIVWIIVVPDVTQHDITCKYRSLALLLRRMESGETCYDKKADRWHHSVGASVNFGVWSTLEPNIAVICACIPSLRPLVTIIRNGVFQHPLIQKSFKSTITSVMSSKPKWGGDSTSSEVDGRFSRLEEMDEMRPLGHGVVVGTGTRATSTIGKDEGADMPADLAVPSRGIKVKTDVVVETSERLTYNDRLY